MSILIRPMHREDNAAMLNVIQECVLEFGYTHSPYLHDASEEDIISNYPDPNTSRMYVLEDDVDGRIIGGGGFAPLEGEAGYSEIMQVYFLPRARGQGIGKKLVKRLMDEAAACGYTHYYIESVPEMETAIRLYESLGFTPLTKRMGSGGHSVCSIFMHRPVNPEATEERHHA